MLCYKFFMSIFKKNVTLECVVCKTCGTADGVAHDVCDCVEA